MKFTEQNPCVPNKEERKRCAHFPVCSLPIHLAQDLPKCNLHPDIEKYFNITVSCPHYMERTPVARGANNEQVN